jgi:amicyanin
LKEKDLLRRIKHNSNEDGVHRRGFLKYMAWAGAAVSSGAIRAAGVSFENTANTAEVKIDNFSFVPKSLTVKAGETVTWTNRDDIPHVIVSTDKKFSSPVLDTDQAFSFTFKEPGSYPYFCKIHPTMTGTIVVAKSESKTT